MSGDAGPRDSLLGARARFRERLPRLITFAVAAGIVVAYALPDGAYDLVIRQEYGLVVWAVVAIGFAAGLLPRSRPSVAALVVLGALFAYTAWVGLSLAWTESAERTFAELARAVHYLGFCVLLGSVIDRKLWRSATAGFGFGALVVCGLAVASRLFPSAFPVNTVGIVFQTDRLSYPLGYWNALGAWGAMSIAIGLGWSANDGVRLRRSVMLAGVPLAGAAVYLSYSRAGAAGAALAGLAVLALSRHRWTALIHAALAGFGTALTIDVIRAHPQIAHGTGTQGASSVFAVIVFACGLCMAGAWLCTVGRTDRWRVPRSVARPATIAAVVALVLGAAAFGPHLGSRAWHQFRNPALPAAGANPTQRLTTLSGTRYNLWAVALKAFDARPLTGIGAGTYEFWWNRHARDTEFVLNAHSLGLETMAELGAPGLLAILAFAVSALALLIVVRRRSHRRGSIAASTAAAAAFIVFLLHASVDWMWQLTAVTILALGGLVAASGRLSQGPLNLRLWGRAVIVACALVGAAIQVPGLLSTREIRRSQAAEQAGNGALALSWARAAVDAEPWAASPHEQEGLVLESAGRLRAAAAELRHAVENEPTNYAHWLILARIEVEQGRLSPAARDYERARSLRPQGEVFNPPR